MAFSAEALVEVAKDYESKGVKVVAISSNSVNTHPQDGPDLMAEDAKKLGDFSQLELPALTMSDQIPRLLPEYIHSCSCGQTHMMYSRIAGHFHAHRLVCTYLTKSLTQRDVPSSLPPS